jgi:hypothetical protein
MQSHRAKNQVENDSLNKRGATAAVLDHQKNATMTQKAHEKCSARRVAKYLIAFHARQASSQCTMIWE